MDRWEVCVCVKLNSQTTSISYDFTNISETIVRDAIIKGYSTNNASLQ